MKFFKSIDKKTFESFPAIGGLMVSKIIADESIKPGFMYREKRTTPEDSGWRIFTGFESEEYINDPTNSGIYNPSTILKIDSTIEDILLKGVGSVYERVNANCSWVKVTDFDMDDDYMITNKLTEGWTIEINNLFERSIEKSGNLFYTTGDKSLRILIWTEYGKSKNELYVEYLEIVRNRDQENSKTLKTFDISDEKIARTGYLIKEITNNKSYNALFAFTIIKEEIIQIAFYFDYDEDITWAIDTWKNIKYERD